MCGCFAQRLQSGLWLKACSSMATLPAMFAAQPVTPSASLDVKAESQDSEPRSAGTAGQMESPPESKVGFKLEMKAEMMSISDLQQMEVQAKDATLETFHEIAFKLGSALMEKHGGPMQWLMAEFGSKEDAGKSFAKDLERFKSSRSDLNYITGPTGIVDNDKDVMCLSLSDLSYFPDSTTKPAPYKSTCRLLLDDMLTHGFLTESDTHALKKLRRVLH